MDYVEAFKNLKTNNKYGRKSPHKAVLMLTVIELYEKNILTENEICYDDSLKSLFQNVWNKVLPHEPTFHPDAYLPFWYLQSDSFWHIVPKRGKEDILSLMRDSNIKPSESKLNDSVRCAELDDDLYFLMTIPSGRSSLKRALLETYTTLSEKQIEKMSESMDNTIDYSASALSDYEKILSQRKDEVTLKSSEVDNELVCQFQKLNEDIQIELNLQYYSFLKSHRNEREIFKEVCPTVYDLLDKIITHPVRRGDILPSFAFIYDNFLSDIKIALMSEEGAMEIIEKINEAIDLLRGNINNVGIIEPIVETKEEELPTSDIEESSYSDEEDTFPQEYIIENKRERCYILNNRGERVFSSEGQLIRLKNVFYRLIFLDSLVSMYIIQEDSKGIFSLGRRILSAKARTPLYGRLDVKNYSMQFKAVKHDDNCDEYYIQVDDRWYGSSGYYADLNSNERFIKSRVVSPSEQQPFNIVDEEPSSQINESTSENVEVEHVYLDSHGEIVDKVVTNSFAEPEKNTATENRKGKPWTKEEEDVITRHFNQGRDASTIASIIGRTEVAIKTRLAKLGLIEYTYGQDEQTSAIENDGKNKTEESDFTIENSFTRCSIKDKNGERVFSSEGKLKYINGKLYRLNQKTECFTLKSMQYNGEVWIRSDKKIVAYPKTELYSVMSHAINNLDDVEDIVDSPIFENCKLKVEGIWYNYNGNLMSDTSNHNKEEDSAPKQNSKSQRIMKNPLYAVRRQALLRAMGFFRLPAKIRDIARTISRTAWGSTIREDEVEDIIKTLPEIESIEGKYILRKKR